MNASRPTSHRPRGRRGFTLIEVMISIAIVLALIIGINQVFSMAARTVGTGMASSAKIRDSKAMLAVVQGDISHAVVKDEETPFFIIDSRSQPAFQDRHDQETDLDFAAATNAQQQLDAVLSQDLDADNQEGPGAGERSTPASVNNRVHRVDVLSFFGRDQFRRQTGNVDAGIYVADMSSNEAWITYEHVRVFNQTRTGAAPEDVDANYPPPGYPLLPTEALPGNPANTKNYYASEWVLGRVAMLLVPPYDDDSDTFAERIDDNPMRKAQPQNPQNYWMRMKASAVQKEDVEKLEPLGRETQVYVKTGVRPNPPQQPTISDARYDLAGTTISAFREELREYIRHTNDFARSGATAQSSPTFIDPWWDVLPSSPVAAPPPTDPNSFPGRFRANPYPLKPIDARKAAQVAPALLGNCSQFIVEYAGDFLTQENDPTSSSYGDIINNPNFTPASPFHPDGTIDFHVRTVNGVLCPQVRWYGFPRDVSGPNGEPDGIIRGSPSVGTAGPEKHNELLDVVPLRDVILTAPGGLGAYPDGMPFERIRYRDPTNTLVTVMPARNNYANTSLDPSPTGITAANGMNPANHYTCAWGPNDPNKPKMIRIVVRVDDADGKLSGGQTYEYVINLP